MDLGHTLPYGPVPFSATSLPLALDQLVTGHPQRDAVLSHARDLTRRDIAVGGEEAAAVDSDEAMA